MQTEPKRVKQFQYSGTEKQSSTTENAGGIIKTKVTCQNVQVGFKLLSERV